MSESDDAQIITKLQGRSRTAIKLFSKERQGRVDEAVTALAWSIYKSDRSQLLAKTAVEETGMGCVDDKFLKNRRKTFGTLRDLSRVRSVGVLDDNPTNGIVRYGKPVGVVAAVIPSTNPAATTANIAMMAVKGGNAIIFSPSPKAATTVKMAVDFMRDELQRAHFPSDLVQVLPGKPSKFVLRQLLSAVDLSIITGSADNVRLGYASGKPCLGVGAGNAAVIIDTTAPLKEAVAKIIASKTFDYGTSCSSENSLIILDAVYDAVMSMLIQGGGYLVSPEEKKQLESCFWINGQLNRDLVAREAKQIARICNLNETAQTARFIIVEETHVGKSHHYSDEKMSVILTVYRARDIDEAIARTRQILDVKGKGHSCGIHTNDLENAEKLAIATDVVRVIVNQAHVFAAGGSFDNGLNFTLTLGCGTWAGNSFSENLNYKHFMNITHLVNPIEPDEPSELQSFGEYWSKYGAE